MIHSTWKGLATLALIVGALTASQTAIADDGRHYRVTITNATLGQPIAPSLFITHDAGFSLFEIGDAATLALATMAESGDPGWLATAVDGAGGVSDFVILPFDRTPPVMLPSESNSATITALGNAKFFTAVGMLAATNDGFYAVRAVPLPKEGAITVYADAYDAGSELNDQLDGHIPATTSGNTDAVGTKTGEGYIHVHSGVHDLGGGEDDLDPTVHDWRNPVLEITIERVYED